jgi:hypothetical protein
LIAKNVWMLSIEEQIVSLFMKVQLLAKNHIIVSSVLMHGIYKTVTIVIPV